MSVEAERAAWEAERAAQSASMTEPYTVTQARRDRIRWAAPCCMSRLKSRSRVARRGETWTAEWTRPTKRALGTILYVHGANSSGSVESYRRLTGDLCHVGHSYVFSLEYRRPPEVDYLLTFADVLSAIAYLAANYHPTQRVILAGDSFGAAPALAAALHLRDNNLAQVAGVYLLCPKTDYSDTAPRDVVSRDPDVCPARRAQWGYWNECGSSDLRASPYLADLSSLPPVLIHTSTADNLYPDATALRDKLLAAGNTCTFREWETVPHIWPYYGDAFTAGEETMRAAGAWIRSQFT